MFFATPILAALIGSVLGSPLAASQPEARAATQSPFADTDILTFALVLEHLEAAFYRQALANYTSSDFDNAKFASGTRGLIERLAYDEAVHVTTLSAVLTQAGATPAQECTYAFGTTDVKSFMGLAYVAEYIGTGAYNFALQYISNADYLVAAGSILAVEARHQSLIALKDNQDPLPSPFETPLAPRFVATLAGQFITTCPNNGSYLPVQGFPALTVTTSSPSAGSDISLTAAGNTSTSTATHCGFLSGIGMNYTTFQNGTCQVPSGFVGQTYVVLTSSNSSLADENVIAGPAFLALGQGSANGTIISGSSSSGTNSNSGSGSNSGNNSGDSNGAARLSLGLTALTMVAGALILI